VILFLEHGADRDVRVPPRERRVAHRPDTTSGAGVRRQQRGQSRGWLIHIFERVCLKNGIEELWKSKPDVFIVKPNHHMLGPNT
jgi:hypothetical protein